MKRNMDERREEKEKRSKEEGQKEERKALQRLELISQGATGRSRKLLLHPLEPPLKHTHL